MTASRIAVARAYLKANGRRVAGAVPFGYTADPRTKQLVVIPEEGQIVLRIFQWAASKMTPSTIAAVFTFRVGEAMMDLDGAPYGGSRYPVEAILGGRTFVKSR